MKICLAMLLATSLYAQAPAAGASCESLASLKLADTNITRAQSVPAGKFAATPAGILADGAPAFRPYSLMPAFCHVQATLTPSSDSEIKMELWMPATGWNGRFQAQGNGGWAGTIALNTLAGAVIRGYAVAATDTGHAANQANGGGAAFAFHHPEKLIDFGYRAVHLMTVESKALMQAYYGKPPDKSYWVGCSTGGRQGLMEAQRYPADYDGIIAGAPANYMTHLLTGIIGVSQAVLNDPASFIPPAKYAVIHRAVMEACDARDGVKDGVLTDPRTCRFDLKTIQCAGEDAPSCLTAAQVEAARKIYAASKNPRTGSEIFPGLEPGSEMGWAGLAGPEPLPIASDFFKYIVFENPNWDFKTLNFDKDVARADAMDHGILNATDPNLKAYFGRGGKLLMYHGWNDPQIAPENSVHYYESVVKALGGVNKVSESVRLFMAPGMNHCAGGDGPSNMDCLAALEQWVEKKQPPEQIVASHIANGKVDVTRPLCPYPQIAVYKGTGDTNDAASFVCKAK
jgi:feruloyl esterase